MRGYKVASINKSIIQITALEELTHKDTPLHRLQPTIKLIITVIYVLTVISFRPEMVSGLVPFICFPVFFMILGEIPLKPLAIRCSYALPFAFFSGVSNLFISRDVVISIGKFYVTEGMISFTSLLLKTILTVMCVLILMSTTSMNEILYSLIGLHIPSLIVIQIMMTYRYMGVLLEEASVMYHAYLLRAPKEKGIKMKDMGSFLGQLILRSFDRAERIYQAMKCRGFEGSITFSKKEKLGVKGWSVLLVVGFLLVILRFVNLSEMIGHLWIS
jgi:cobalt/nickel transport system permease protein